MEIEKLIDIKILCGQVIEKVNELLEIVDTDNVDIKSLSERTKLQTEETSGEDVDIDELSKSSEYHTQDDLLNDSIKTSVNTVLANDDDYNLKKSFEGITNTAPVETDFALFSEKADSAVYMSEDEKLKNTIEVSNIIINDSITDNSEDISYPEIAKAITETSPLDEEE